jgi:hypothetical protein
MLRAQGQLRIDVSRPGITLQGKGLHWLQLAPVRVYVVGESPRRPPACALTDAVWQLEWPTPTSVAPGYGPPHGPQSQAGIGGCLRGWVRILHCYFPYEPLNGDERKATHDAT